MASTPDPGGLALDASNVYWTSGGTDVMKVALTGGTPVTIASGQNGLENIAVAGDTVYLCSYHSNDGGTSGYTLMKVAAAGGTPATVATGTECYLVVGAGSGKVYGMMADRVLTPASSAGPLVTLPRSAGTTWNVAVDATAVYWANDSTQNADGTSNSDGSVVKMPLSGGTPVTLASGLNCPHSVAVDSTGVYFVNDTKTCSDLGYNAAVMKVALSGGTPVKLADDTLGPGGLAVDATGVYWDFGWGDKNGFDPIAKVSLAGGTPQRIVQWGGVEGEGIGGYVVGAKSVYFTTNGSKVNHYTDGRIMKLTPK